MDNEKNINQGEVFRTFSHKTKINPGNKNDNVLMQEIQEITRMISFSHDTVELKPYNRKKVAIEDLREDEIGKMNNEWLSSAPDMEDGYIKCRMATTQRLVDKS